MMNNDHDGDIEDDEYDEEADSDFDGYASNAASESSSEAHDNNKGTDVKVRKKAKDATVKPLIEELDSGDEATIKERKKSKKKEKRRNEGAVSSDEDEKEGWRAKTRSMRSQEQAEKQRKKLANLEASTIDVNKLWEEINKPGPLPPVRIEGEEEPKSLQSQERSASQPGQPVLPPLQAEEMITIKRQFKFAGEIHSEEKVVAKSSAEAQLWLAQQENKKASSETSSDQKHRPLRKISRFDPNYSNHEAFRNHAIKAQPAAFRGPRLNVVEKSKMDWATHVDAEGLKEELDVHAKAKDAYLNRMDFLNRVEQRKEDEARDVRQRG